MILEAVIVILFVGSLFMIAPSVLGVVSTAMPVPASNTQLTASFNAINGVATGGLNIGAIAFIALALGVMVAGFMIFMPRQG